MVEDENKDVSPDGSIGRMKAQRSKAVRDALGNVSPLEDVVIEDSIGSGQPVDRVIDALYRHREQKNERDQKKKERLREIIGAVRRRVGPQLSVEQIAAILSHYESDSSLTEEMAVVIVQKVGHRSSATPP